MKIGQTMTLFRSLRYRVMALGLNRPNGEKEPEPENAERLICGYTTREHLILDLDTSHSLAATIGLVRMIQHEFPDVGDCLICQSSWKGYHCIFDDKISWSRILQISSTLAGLQIVNRNYIKIRKFREDLTLRVSSIDRGEKKSEAPKPVIIILANRTFPCASLPVIEVYREKSDVSFSGISEYLEVLSGFRGLSTLFLQAI